MSTVKEKSTPKVKTVSHAKKKVNSRIVGYRKRFGMVSRATVYETDDEIAEMLNNIPNAEECKRKYGKYLFLIDGE